MVFRRNADDDKQWSPLGNTIQGLGPYDFLGESTSLLPSGGTTTTTTTTTVAIGASGGDYVVLLSYDPDEVRNGGGIWKVQQRVEGETGDRFGHSLAVASNGSKILPYWRPAVRGR